MTAELNPYVADILRQPDAIRDTVTHYRPDVFAPVTNAVATGTYDRIVLSGMGASHHAAYPAWLHLVVLGLPAWSLTASELLHHAPSLVTDKTLLWLTSQSGASAEVQALIEQSARNRPKTVLAITADPDSPLGRAADTVLQLHIGTESTVSTGSYVSTLALHHLAVTQIAGGDVERARGEMMTACTMLETYLADWRRRVEQWEILVGVPQRLYLIGRGPSLAAARTGSLIIKESARFAVEGMTSAQFRHGPLELADERLTVIVLAGSGQTRSLNERLATEIQRYGATVAWVDVQENDNLPIIRIPELPSSLRPVSEIAPLQLLSLALAWQTGVEPGVFRRIGKVTRTL